MSSTSVGAGLGGAAGARDRRQNRELVSRRLDIEENQFKAEQRAERLQEIRERFSGLAEQAGAFIENSPLGRDDPNFQEGINMLRTTVATLAARAAENFPGEIDARTQVNLFNNIVRGTPTPVEAAQTEARGDVAGARVTTEAVGGDERTLGVLLGTEALTEPEKVRLQNERDAAEARGDTRAATELTNIINRAGTVTGTTEFDPSGPGFATALTTPTEDDVERLRTNLRENQSSFETAANTLAAVEEAGALAVGFAGAATEGFTGFMGNIGALGEAINAGFENVTGADLEKLTAARTSMREGVSSALAEITNEEGSRYTDTERRIANEVLRGLTPASDIKQVVSAYEQYFRILNTSDVRNAQEIMRGAQIDLGTSGALNRGGVDQLGTILRDLGMSEERILEILEQVVPR